MLKNEKGITLVALVVTIVVLLILAGVSLSLVLGQNGIVTKAQAGAVNYKTASNEEIDQITGADTMIDQILTNVSH